MEEIIEELIKIEDRANEINIAIEDEKKRLQDVLQETEKKIYEDIKIETDGKIRKMRENYLNETHEIISKMLSDSQQHFSEIEKAFEVNHTVWEDEIIKTILGGEIIELCRN